MAIEEILDLEQLEINIYRGGVFSPESGFLQRTFGGHVAGQSLVSAVRTVEPRFQVHSLHGYFLRPGDAKAATVFIVERLRDGGSFVTRRVNAIQHGETIFSMSASFQADQSGIEHQDAMPFAVPPDDLPDFTSKGGAFDDAGCPRCSYAHDEHVDAVVELVRARHEQQEVHEEVELEAER